MNLHRVDARRVCGHTVSSAAARIRVGFGMETLSAVVSRARLRWLVVCGLSILLTWISGERVCAQTLDLKIDTFQARTRSHAPIPLELNLSWDSFEILEGRLELLFHDHGRDDSGALIPIAHYRSAELALAAGDRRYGIQLPPQRITNSLGVLGIEATFVTSDEEKVIELGSHELNVPPSWQRRLRMGVVLPESSQFASSTNWLPLTTALRVEQFRSEKAIAGDRQPGPLLTRQVRVLGKELPKTPAELCVYDLLILTRDGFPEVRSPSCKALAKWVQAGGSLLIDAGGVLQTEHVKFLNQMWSGQSSSGDQSEGPVQLLPDGRIRIGEEGDAPADQLSSWEVGLGRLILTTDSLENDVDLDSDAWRRAVCFLWKVRSSQQQRMQGLQSWNWQESPVAVDERLGIFPGPFEPATRVPTTELIKALLPDRVQSVPMWHVILLLIVFLLLIAPGDYLLLGLLRRRTLTWILFPTVSLAVTLYTVRLAQNTVGSTDYRTSLNIVDVIDDSTVARTTRIEMLFTAAERDAVIEARGEMFVPLVDTAALAYGYEQPAATSDGTFQLGVQHEAPVFDGQLPRRYRVIRRMRKWTPQLCRRTWIGRPPEEELPEFDWNMIPPDRLRDEGSRREVFSAVSKRYPGAQLRLVSGDRLTGDLSAGAGTGGVPSPSMKTLLDFVVNYSTPADTGLSAVMSPLSPSGAADMEDLYLLDSSRPGQILVVVMLPQGDDYYAFRRVFQF